MSNCLSLVSKILLTKLHFTASQKAAIFASGRRPIKNRIDRSKIVRYDEKSIIRTDPTEFGLIAMIYEAIKIVSEKPKFSGAFFKLLGGYVNEKMFNLHVMGYNYDAERCFHTLDECLEPLRQPDWTFMPDGAIMDWGKHHNYGWKSMIYRLSSSLRTVRASTQLRTFGELLWEWSTRKFDSFRSKWEEKENLEKEGHFNWRDLAKLDQGFAQKNYWWYTI